MTLTPELTTWIETLTGGRIVAVEQQVRWRPHHFITLERGDETLSLLARGEREPETVAASKFLTHFDIDHEAQVLEALQGHGLLVSKFYGYNTEHKTILMERAEGSNLLADAPDDAARTQVMKQYFEQLARLHSIDISSMKLSDIEIPTTPEELAFKGKFAWMEDDYRALRPRLRPEPLLDLGVWWLHDNVPEGDRPLSVVQGDTGPGQFMFSGDRLTALIDWELSHIGDPMLDLGVVRMRNMLYPTGPLREPITHYERVSGNPIDWSVLGFYTVLSMLLTPLGVVLSVQRPSAKLESQLARFGWDMTLRRGLCDALAEVLSIDIDPPELPDPIQNDWPSLGDYLTEQLEIGCLPIAHDAAERYKIDTALALARTLQRDSKIGAKLLADDLDDMAGVVGRRPADRDEGLAQLQRLVDEDPTKHLEDLVRLFGRIERRREHLLAPLTVDQRSEPFERLAPR